MVPQRLKQMVTDGLSLDVTYNQHPLPRKEWCVWGIVYRKEPSIVLEIIQVVAKVVSAIMTTGQFILRLVEHFEHKKSNRPNQG